MGRERHVLLLRLGSRSRERGKEIDGLLGLSVFQQLWRFQRRVEEIEGVHSERWTNSRRLVRRANSHRVVSCSDSAGTQILLLLLLLYKWTKSREICCVQPRWTHLPRIRPSPNRLHARTHRQYLNAA